uniref:C3H1-type domain-containing protein n=1 Tax=Moniliophthora roreri TaxID=221103 RepID=A0A0W0FW85_MONRR
MEKRVITKASRNRHTKPCRYFQSNTCPKNEEQCDFAHIIASDPILLQHSRPCRFYLAGYCRNGGGCRFRHIDSDHSSEEATHEPLLSTIPDSESIHEFTAGSHPSPSFGNPVPAIYLPSPSYWPSYEYLAASHYYSYPDEPVYCLPKLSSGSLPPVQHESDLFRIRIDLKTKPVTLGHSKTLQILQRLKEIMSEGRYVIHTDPATKRFGTSTSAASYESDEAGLPQKPLSPLEASRKRGFYPITWRVIGGGVLMGTERPERFQTSLKNQKSSRSQSRSRSPATTPTVNVNVPVSTANSSRIRARANSIPSTPSINQVDASALFAAAESP